MKNSINTILLLLFFFQNNYSQTFRKGFDSREHSSGGGNGQGASLQSNVTASLHNNESVFLIGYIKMFQATHDKRYLDQFIIHSKRVQERRDDNISLFPFSEIQGFPASFNNADDDLLCQILGLDQIDPTSKGWSFNTVEVDENIPGFDFDDEYSCDYGHPAIVQSGEITYPMALFVWYMQSDPAFMSLASASVPVEAQTVLASGGCSAISIMTYQDFANWLQCRIDETIDYHEPDWGVDQFGNSIYLGENLNGQTSIGRVIALFYLITGDPFYHQRATDIAWLVTYRLGTVDHFVNVNGVDKQYYTWLYGWGDHECTEDPGHAYLTMQFAEICTIYEITNANDGTILFNTTDMERFANTYAYRMYHGPLVELWQSTDAHDNVGFECGKGGGGSYTWLAKYNPYIFQIQSDAVSEGAIYVTGGHLTVFSDLALLQSKNDLSNTLNGENFKFNPVAVRRGQIIPFIPISVQNMTTGDFDNNGLEDLIIIRDIIGQSSFLTYTPEICDNPNIGDCWLVAESNSYGFTNWKGITSGDFDLSTSPLDHAGDEIIALNPNGNLHMLKQVGSLPGGTFTEEILFTSQSWAGITSADFKPAHNGDEAIGLTTTGDLYFFSYSTPGFLTTIPSNSIGINQPVGITAGQFDPSDIRPQIAVLDGSNGYITIFSYDVGTNSFIQIQQNIDAGCCQWNAITSGDFDGDGIDEIAAHQNQDGQIKIFKVKTTGLTNIYNEYFMVDQAIGALATGKFNLNSNNDELIVIRNFDNQITIFNIEGHCPNLYLNDQTITDNYSIDNDGAVIENDYPIDYHVSNTLVSSNFILANGVTADFVAGKEVSLKTGTVITSGSHFHAYIDPVLSCGPDQFLKSANSGSNPSVEKEKIPLAQKAVTDSTFSLIADIYPNPNDGKFNLQLENFVGSETATITIYNSLGVIVYENATANLRSSIDISNQASGLYFIKVQSGGKVYAGKVVKQ